MSRWTGAVGIATGAAAQKASPAPSPKVSERKRHARVDTLGLMLRVVVHPANILDSTDASGREACPGNGLERPGKTEFPAVAVQHPGRAEAFA